MNTHVCFITKYEILVRTMRRIGTNFSRTVGNLRSVKFAILQSYITFSTSESLDEPVLMYTISR